MDTLEKLANQLEILTQQAKAQLLDVEKEIDAVENKEAREFFRESLKQARKGDLSTKQFTEKVKSMQGWA